MTGFGDVAAGVGGGPEIVLAGDLGSEPRAELAASDWDDVTPADELTPEGQFPEYGQFVAVRRYNGGGYEDEEVWWNLPSGLAALIEMEIEEAGGYEKVEPEQVTVDIDFAGKSEAGEWKFSGDVNVRDP